MGRMTAKKRILSIFLAVLIAFTGIIPATAAFAGDGVEGYNDIELFYKDTDTIVPTYQEDGTTKYIEYMKEGDELNLTYKLIDTVMPDNGYIKWYSETPTLVDVTQEGVVKAFDSSKGAVIQTWIDNEVKTIPLVGGIIATVIQKALFNDKINVDSMDTEAIVKVVEDLFGTGSPLDKWIDSYKGEIIDSLRKYLDNINSNIHVQLFDAAGNLLDDDFVQICVLKNEEWYANFLPNGTHITNKSQINTTVAVGSTTQLYAVTTPLRLKYGVVYSVKSSSIFDKGKVIATVDDSGLVTFKNTGTVTIMVSPDTEQIIAGILKLVNYIYQLDHTGTINTDKVAEILIKYIGIDMNRNVLKAILDVCFAIKDIAGDVADPIQLTATAVEIISNLVLQFVYNDTITFNVVEAQPITDFKIAGANTVAEGAQIQLEITDIEPTTGDTSDITWSSSDPSIASVDPKTGVITGRDAGGSLGALSSQKCIIYATSAANNIQKSYEITVKGNKMGKYLSDVEITGKNYLEMGEQTDFTYSVYPKRVAESDNLYINWGILNGTDEEGNPIYIWADSETPATDGIGTIDSKGHYTATDGGECTIAVKASTGYYLANQNFYEISSFIGTLNVKNGVPIDSIQISAVDAYNATAVGNDKLNSVNTVEINGKEYTYATIKKGIGESYNGSGAIISAAINPSNATNQKLKWVIDNKHYKNALSDDTHTATITQNAGHEVADTFNVYVTSEDGRIKSNTITVCVTRNYAKTNVINEDAIDIINGKTADSTHSMTFDGNLTSAAYACRKCNWYSSDESVFTVENKNNDNSDAVLTGVDVGTATLYCVSADGGIVDSCQVTVKPDKERLQNIVRICDRTIVKRTAENKTLYNEYMRQLDLAYYVLYDEPMASQAACDTYANELLYAFYKVGGFVGISGVKILDSKGNDIENNHITIDVDSLGNYTKYSCKFSYKVNPASAMYSSIEWTSSNSTVKVDSNGKCTPASNDPASAIITCTVTDYMGNKMSDRVFLTFAKNPVTGITLNTDKIEGGKIGETQTLTATVAPDKTVGGASCKDVYWHSSDESIATVDQNGVVTFVAGGDCTIYCTTYDGGFTAQCAVNVVTNYTALELLVKQYNDLSLNPINYYPDSWAKYVDTMEKAQNMLDERSSSQAQVDKMADALEKSYKELQKYNYIQKIELYLDGEQTKEFYQYDVNLFKEGIKYNNALLDLNVRLYPNNASYASVKWISSTSDISVTNEGVCSPTVNRACYGNITCIVTDHFGNTFSDSVWVSFAYNPVTGLQLSDDSVSGAIGETYRLSCTVLPEGSPLLHINAADIKDYYWESDNEEVATISQDGTITFISAGSTKVRAVSYDGGISAECIVSTDGDRSALYAALEQYKDVDYKQYEYNFGIAFKNAYENADLVMNDKTVSQADIDTAAIALNDAYTQMIEHPFIQVNTIDIAYTTYEKPLPTSSGNSVVSGSIASSNALSIDLSNSKYANWNSYNFIRLTANPNPGESMYKTLQWTVNASQKMKSDINNSTITLTPTEFSSGGWANITVTIVDQYDRTYTRTVNVIMSDNTVKAFDITNDETTVYVTDDPKQLTYTITDNAEFKTIDWSSSNESVITVDENGVITPVDKGTATVTGKTRDGGITDSITVKVLTDFRALAQKQNEYYNLIESVKDSYTYTQESLDVLAAAVADAKTMIDDNRATQAEVRQMIEKLDNAYQSLVEYVASTGVSIGFDQDSNVSSVNEGFIRYSGSVSLNGKSVVLMPIAQPEGSIYSSVTWESSNPNITIDENGILTNNTATAGVTKITCRIKNVFDKEAVAYAYVSFVRIGVNEISFDKELVYGAPAQTVTLSPKFNTGATLKDCVYISSDENIATVDASGVVTFVSQGEATITATALDGGYTAQIKAYTTWDTTALKAAIDAAAAIHYMDYAYSYGMAFKSAFETAQEVYANIYASQDEIDTACTVLTEAVTALEGHEFIAPAVTISQNGTALESGAFIEADDNGLAAIDVLLNDGAMVKSTNIEITEEKGVTVQLNGNTAAITKTAESGSFTLTVTTIDDYDTERVNTYTFNVIDIPIPATSIALTADGTAVTGPISHSCGGKYSNFTGMTIGYLPTPENANSIVEVTYTSSNSTNISVDENGFVEATTAAKMNFISASIKTTITCTIKNLDGTTATASVDITLTRK